MAKKAKKEDKKKTKLPAYMKTLDKNYKKDYGEIVVSGLDVLETRRNHKILHTTPNLDMGVGGGLKEGTLNIFSGAEGSGKTTLALYLAAKHMNDTEFVQPNGDKGRPVFYFNSEARLGEKNFSGIKGLDPEKLKVVQKSKGGKIIPAEVFLDSSIEIMGDPDNFGAMLIIDSTSSLIPQSELDENIKAGRNTLPRLLASWCKKACQIIPDNNITLIIITHVISDTSPTGRGWLIPDSGRKIRFAADTILVARSVQKWVKSDGDVDHIGQVTKWDIRKSALASTIKSCETWLRYGLGMDEVKEAIDIALDFNLIYKSGNWFYPEGEDGDVKLNGINQFMDWIDENPEYSENLLKEVRGYIT